MNKTNLLWGVLVSSAVFLFGCSSDCEDCNCDVDKPSPSSSSVKTPSSSSGGEVPDRLIRETITLSSDKSYADIDGEEPAAYAKEYATSNPSKIDLIAYCGTGKGYCENNSIYRPEEINLFWNKFDFLGKDVYLYEIPDAQAEILRTAKKYSEIVATLRDIIDTLNSTNCGVCVEEIPIAEDKVFYVNTSDKKNRIAIIKEIGNQSIDLEIIITPGG